MPAESPGPAQNPAPPENKGEPHPALSNSSPVVVGGGMETGEHNAFAREAAKWAHERHQQAGDRGLLGKFFGGREEKAGNIAGLMAVACFVAIAALLLTADMWENIDAAAAAVLGATLTACLGYLFGRK